MRKHGNAVLQRAPAIQFHTKYVTKKEKEGRGREGGREGGEERGKGGREGGYVTK